MCSSPGNNGTIAAVVETPTSLANDSQLHQLISQMQQMRDVEDSDEESDMGLIKGSHN